MRTFFKLLILSLAAFHVVGCGEDRDPSNEAKAQAREVADTMRTTQRILRPEGDDKLRPSEIDALEKKIATVLDEDNQIDMLCSLHVANVTALVSLSYMPDYFNKLAEEAAKNAVTAEVAKLYKQQAEEMQSDYLEDVAEITPGSLRDWLFQMGLKRLKPEMTEAARKKAFSDIHHECSLQPFSFIKDDQLKMR